MRSQHDPGAEHRWSLGLNYSVKFMLLKIGSLTFVTIFERLKILP